MWSPTPAGLDLLDRLPDPVFTVDSALRLTWANAACEASLGYARGEWFGRSVLGLIHPDDVPIVISRALSLTGVPLDVRVVAAGGRKLRWEILASHLDPAQRDGFLVTARDTTLRHSLDVDGGDVGLLRALVNYSSAMLALISPDGLVRSISGAFVRQLGYDQQSVAGTHYDDWIVPDDRPRVLAALAGLERDGSVTLDATMRHADGHEVLVEFTVVDLCDDPEVNALVVSGQVANSLRAARQRADFLSSHDPATGLLNRAGFFEAGAVLERHAARSGEPLAVVMADLDRLSQINELFGAAAGDAVIQSCAARLAALVRPEDVVGRYDGDEFVIATIGPMDGVISIRDRVLAALEEPIVIDGFEMRMSASVAIASGMPPVTLSELVDSAAVDVDHAYRFALAPPVHGAAAIVDRRNLVDQLKLALDRHELHVWFQPIVDGSGVTVAFEGLLRWEHPTRGVLTPGTFLPLVAMAGLADRVDRLVADQSLAFIAALGEIGRRDITVHINISPGQLSRPGFAAELTMLREARGIAAEQCCVEITESDVLRINNVALDNLAHLRRSGTHIAIDDFGTGFSSLAHLLELPVDMLKIDRRFVDGLGVDPMATSLTTAILGLTTSVGLGCVAEGVETPEQRDQLVALGCPQLQGWLFDAAMPADQALRLVARLPTG